MQKYKLLAFVNVLLAALLGYFIVSTLLPPHSSTFSLEIFINTHLPLTMFFLFVLGNLILAYKILLSKQRPEKAIFTGYIFLTAYTVLWTFFLFFGFFFASNFSFLLFSIVLIATTFFLAKKFAPKFAFWLTLVTALTAITAIAYGFEEDYCENKGFQADRTGGKMVTATKEDEEMLGGFEFVKEGSEIGLSFREHMLCHNTFDFVEAVKEKYILQK